MFGILWCRHCGAPHRLGAKTCDRTAKAIDPQLHRGGRIPRHPLIGRIIDGKYRVRRLLGVGGMGEVFEAESLHLEKRVAIKIVWTGDVEPDAHAIARLRREALLIASIDHPNICRLHEVGALEDGGPYLVLERLYGQTLHARLREKRPLPQATLADLFDQILTAVHAVHSVGIVHRDLKPANVFLVRRQRVGGLLVKLIDFGFAKDIYGRLDNMTRPGRACGTPTHMSPEQLFAREVDARSDLFCVGLLLFQALAGVHPFAAKTTAEISMNIIGKPTPSLRTLRPEISPRLEGVIQRVLEKSPSRRYTSALEMRDALTAVGDWGLTNGMGDQALPRISYSLAPPSSSGGSAASVPSSH